MDEPRKLTTYPVPRPRPRVEGEAVRQPRLSAAHEELKRWTGMRVTAVRQKQWSLVLLFARRILSDKEALTAEVERLRRVVQAAADDFASDGKHDRAALIGALSEAP